MNTGITIGGCVQVVEFNVFFFFLGSVYGVRAGFRQCAFFFGNGDLPKIVHVDFVIAVPYAPVTSDVESSDCHGDCIFSPGRDGIHHF